SSGPRVLASNAIANGAGEFRLVGVGDKPVFVLVEGVRGKRSPVVEARAGTSGVVLQLVRSPSAVIRIVDADGTPVAHASVTARVSKRVGITPNHCGEVVVKLDAVAEDDGSATLVDLDQFGAARPRVVVSPPTSRSRELLPTTVAAWDLHDTS